LLFVKILPFALSYPSTCSGCAHALSEPERSFVEKVSSMRIYKVGFDAKYQTLTYYNSGDYARFPSIAAPMHQDTRALASILFCRLMPFRKQGDFRSLDPLLTCRAAVLHRVADTLANDAQTFEIRVDDEDEPSYLIYPSNALDAVDMDILRPRMDAEGVKWIRAYEFKRTVFARPQMFIDRYFSGDIFYATDLGSPDHDFYVRYHQLGLTGAHFTQVWEG